MFKFPILNQMFHKKGKQVPSFFLGSCTYYNIKCSFTYGMHHEDKLWKFLFNTLSNVSTSAQVFITSHLCYCNHFFFLYI